MRPLTTILLLGVFILPLRAGEPNPEPTPTRKFASGLKYQDLKLGKGAAARAGNSLRVHYTGWLAANRKKFDSSRGRNQPFTFKLGAGMVIKGLDEGLVGMKVGGKRKLYIPAALAYGARGVGTVIPANADLVFEVELVGIGK